MRAGEAIAAALGVALFGWVTFNLGFDLGADTGACVAFDMTTEIPADENPFCQSAAPVDSQFVQAIRKSWLAVHGEEPAA